MPPVDERDAIGRLLDHELLCALQLEAQLAVEGDPSVRTSLLGEADGDLGVRGEDYRSESQRVCADRRQADDVGLGVRDRAAAAQVVRGASRGRSEHDSVSLDGGPVHIIDVDVEAAHELAGAPGDRDLVERVAFHRLVVHLALRVDEHPFHGHLAVIERVFDGAG